MQTNNTRWLREQARTLYESRFGWVVLGDDGQLVIKTGIAFDALTMPAAFGPVLLGALRSVLPALGVIAESNGRWTMLTGLASSSRLPVPAALLLARVRPLPRFAPVALPVPVTSNVPPRWVVLPSRGSDLISWALVASTASLALRKGARS